MSKEKSNEYVEELISKVNKLTPEHIASWGKMNVSEMLLHCSRFIDLYVGKIPLPKWYKIFGVSIGRLFLWYVSKLDPSKTPRNLRTDKRIMVNDKSYDFEDQRALLLKNINSLSKLSGTINHPIYGKMSSDKIIFLIWHHTSHHLNQFGINKKEQNKKPTQ